MGKKPKKKAIKQKISIVEIKNSEEPLEEKIEDFEDKINNDKFVEFLGVSNEPIETFFSKKTKPAKIIEQDEDILSLNIQKKEEKEENVSDYFSISRGKDYDLIEINNSKNRNVFSESDKKREDSWSQGERLNMEKRNTLFSKESLKIMRDLSQEDLGISNRDYIIGESHIGGEVKYKSKRFR